MRLRTFIMGASAIVSIAFFGLSFVAVDRIIVHTVRQNAEISTAATAKVTFAGMFQLMRTGWTHRQAEKFIASMRSAGADAGIRVQIYRGPVVERNFGPIDQPPLTPALRQVLATGKPITYDHDGMTRYLMPLIADARCPACHTRAKVGDTMGVIEVDQNSDVLIRAARNQFLLWMGLLAPAAMLMAGFVVWIVNRRIEQSVAAVDKAVLHVSTVSDLAKVELSGRDLGFTELSELLHHFGTLVEKLRSIAVDKGVLQFEIGLLEKFVITSDVVRDWSEYVSQLMIEINRIMNIQVLFSLFRVDDDSFDLEVFWLLQPSPDTAKMMESYIERLVSSDSRFSECTDFRTNHHYVQGGDGQALLELDANTLALHTKSLILDKPKVGGIVGIGINADQIGDDTTRLVMDSVLSTMLNVIGSVKAIHKYTSEMEYFATRDPLTDLYNRRVFWELLEYEVPRAKRHAYEFGLLVIDLDNFKLVNDQYGHAVGDRYLQMISNTMRQTLRPGDILGRYGGDEFVLLLPNAELESTTVVARRILDEVSAFTLNLGDEGKVSGSVSIGMAVYPLHADNAHDLFLFADNMMYKAKDAGKNEIGIPTEDEVAEVFRDVAHTTSLVVNAVNEGRIIPYFQPILDLKQNRIVAYEVLSRMVLDDQHVEAGRFIEYAEKAGVIHRLDTIVLEKALERFAENKFKGLLFVNLSPRALVIADFVRTLKRAVNDYGIDRGQIVFEITERDTLRNIAVLEGLIRELKMEGFKLAIDDFGSGFSSFQYLRRFPVDFLKIEGDFVAHILDSDKDRAFVQTIGRLAADLGIPVIAEYVENEEVLTALRDMGIDLGQGYYIGRPNAAIGGGATPYSTASNPA
jgi:diguanylate cyclase (GGDEF)-like protein